MFFALLLLCFLLFSISICFNWIHEHFEHIFPIEWRIDLIVDINIFLQKICKMFNSVLFPRMFHRHRSTFYAQLANKPAQINSVKIWFLHSVRSRDRQFLTFAYRWKDDVTRFKSNLRSLDNDYLLVPSCLLFCVITWHSSMFDVSSVT